MNRIHRWIKNSPSCQILCARATCAAAMALAAGQTLGVQTNEVELGRLSNYDGTVLFVRDSLGRMTFKDNEITTPVLLSDLLAGKGTHGELQGLTADDHTQYLDTTRHGSAHDATFNDALAIGLDAGANTTLGAHAQDTQIHADRAAAETISGNWVFSGTPEFQSELYLSAGGAAGDQKIIFEDGASDAEVLWNDTTGRFEVNRDFKVNGGFTADSVNPHSFIGDLGVGVTTPGHRLHVRDHTTPDFAVFIDRNDFAANEATKNGLLVSTYWGSDSNIIADFRNRATSYLSVQGGGSVVFNAGLSTAATPLVVHSDSTTNLFIVRGNSVDEVEINGALDLNGVGNISGDLVLGGEIDQNGAGTNRFAGFVRIDEGAEGTNSIANGAGDLYVEDDLEVEDRMVSGSVSTGMLIAAGSLVELNGELDLGSVSQNLTAASEAITYQGVVRLTSAPGSITLTATPTITLPAITLFPDGCVIYIVNTDGIDTITLQDESQLAGSKLELGAATRALGPGDLIHLMYMAGKWREVAFSNL